MKRKQAALRNVGIDLDARALARFQCDYPVEKIHSCAHRFLRAYDYRGRERIKRKAASWAERYQAMPAPERLAVLSAMMAVEAEGA